MLIAGYFIFTITLIALHFVWVSGVMKRIPEINSLSMMSLSHLFSCVMLAPFVAGEIDLFLQDQALLIAVGIYGVCMLIARLLYYYAYSKVDVAEVAIFSALTPAYTLMLAPLFGYAITFENMLGVLLISAAVYLFFLPAKSDVSFLARLMQPLKRIKNSRALSCAFLSTLPPALAVIYHKEAIHLSSPLFVSFALCFVIGFFGLMIMQFPKKWFCLFVEKERGGHNTKKRHSIARICSLLAVAGLLQALAILSGSYLLEQLHPASMQSLVRLAIPLQIALAYFFLREKTNMPYRLITGGVAVVGAYLIIADIL